MQIARPETKEPNTMSAYVVSEEVIATLVETAATIAGHSPLTIFNNHEKVAEFDLRFDEGRRELFDVLADANVQSVKYRYADDTSDYFGDDAKVRRALDRVGSALLDPMNAIRCEAKGWGAGTPQMVSAVAKLSLVVSCYDYQACEDPGYDSSVAGLVVRFLEGRLMRILTRLADTADFSPSSMSWAA